MELAVSLEQRFLRTPDGAIWTPAAFAYRFWTRYLEVFERVSVLARVRDVTMTPPEYARVDGPALAVVALPYYVGPAEYVLHAGELRRVLAAALRPGNALVLRIPSQIAACLLNVAGKRPYGVEVVGDPWDVFAPGAVRHPLRPLFRHWFAHLLRHQCAGACAASYVTSMALQRRYPPRMDGFKTSYSDVELPLDAFTATPRVRDMATPLRLIHVGTLDQLYKAPDVLLDAMAMCVGRGLDLHLDMVGDGKYRAVLEQQAERLGIAHRVAWHGMLPAGAAVRSRLDAADLFVLPSRTEGLPRAMIEAMARGLPCIGSTAGGIPELLPPEDLVPPGDAAVLASAIQAVANDPDRMAAMSVRNLATARDYADDLLHERRLAFYRTLRDQTERWFALQTVSGIAHPSGMASTHERRAS
ncbi:MAG: glycosyltransferase [Chloroflexi bacterium]|nr:glycosyltransferase [Chloroflexota bacterium]